MLARCVPMHIKRHVLQCTGPAAATKAPCRPKGFASPTRGWEAVGKGDPFLCTQGEGWPA